MATIDPPPGFRDELMAAIAILDPQIAGFRILRKSPLSPEAHDAAEIGYDATYRRWQLIHALISNMDAVLAALQALKNDGYPAPPHIEAMRAVIDELTKQGDALDAAMKIFTASAPRAAMMVFNLGGPTPKGT